MKNGKEKFNIPDVSFCIFRPKHFSVVKSFETDDKDLKEFLVEDALRSQELSISTTFLIFSRKNKRNLLGFVTILNDSTQLDSDLKIVFRDKGITYKAIPSLKIGRLCVDKRFLLRGVGKAALSFAVKRAVFMNQESACRFINVDAKRHKEREKDTFHFYKKFGFRVLKHKKKVDPWKQISGTTPMYLDLYHIIRIAKAKYNF